MNDVSLLVGSTAYYGWENIGIFRSIDSVFGEFTITHTDKWADNQKPKPIKTGQQCELKIDGKTVLTGFVNRVNPYYSKFDHAITVYGRSHTADLVDCSAIDKQYNGQSLSDIAISICAPFGIRVKTVADIGANFDRYSVESETAFQAIDRAARQRGVLLISDQFGNLIITRRGTENIGASLKLGENVIQCNGDISDQDRFSIYTATGQTVSSDGFYAMNATTPKATAKDDGVNRYRPLRIDAEHQSAPDYLKTRAEWERNVRAARGTRIFYTVQGWYAKDSMLWAPNYLVRINDDFLDIDKEMLITDCAYTLDNQGTRCRIGVAIPEAYDLIPIKSSGGYVF